MSLTRQQEIEIYPILDKVLDLPIGKAVLHPCTLARANYLTRIILGLRYDTALESLLMYQESNPLYGKGIYAYIWAEPNEQGLVVSKLPEPYDNTMWRLIRCATEKQSVELDSTFNSARQQLIRAQKKHPEVMERLLLTNDSDPLIIKYITLGQEELIIVDIDINPEKRKIPELTGENLIKSKILSG